jgi:quercetin dioxygenase-like cupin family protein
MNILSKLKKADMRICQKIFYVVFALFAMNNISSIAVAQEGDSTKIPLTPKAITFNIELDEYQELLNGRPSSDGIFSGLVTLKPGEKVGEHDTEHYEEVLVVLSGEGQMIFKNGSLLELKFGVLAYCPPNTAHNVKNTGKKPLKYLYIATDTEK